jgi:microcystin-dependent protein
MLSSIYRNINYPYYMSIVRSFFCTRFRVCVIVFLTGALPAAAQVGFNNPAPDPSSILDLTANDRGVLVPRMTTAQREAINAPAVALLVFDSDKGQFYYYTGTQWATLNAFDHASEGEPRFGAADINGVVPKGGIIMWSGLVTNIPKGWALCDGSVAGRPDLRDRFIVGSGNTYTQGAFGGSNTKTLAPNNMPAHSHTATIAATTGTHTHTYIDVVPNTVQGTFTTNDFEEDQGGASYQVQGSNTTKTTNTGTGAHSHAVTVSTEGSGAAFDIRPPYYALAFIIKL